MGEDVVLDVGKLFSELGNQLRQNAKVALLALALLVGGNLAIDQLGKSSSAAPAAFLSVAVQLYVLRAALQKGQLLPDNSKPKIWSFIWMNLMSTFAILGGCVLLIIPGLYLAARWFVAGPVVIAEDKFAVEALRESWHLTRASAWHLVGAILVLFGGGLGLAILPGFVMPQSAQGVSLDATAYVLMFAAYICGWLMEVGAYKLLFNPHGDLAEVFA